MNCLLKVTPVATSEPKPSSLRERHYDKDRDFVLTAESLSYSWLCCSTQALLSLLKFLNQSSIFFIWLGWGSPMARLCLSLDRHLFSFLHARESFFV